MGWSLNNLGARHGVPPAFGNPTAYATEGTQNIVYQGFTPGQGGNGSLHLFGWDSIVGWRYEGELTGGDIGAPLAYQFTDLTSYYFAEQHTQHIDYMAASSEGVGAGTHVSELVDVLVNAAIEDVLRVLGLERIAARLAVRESQGGAGDGRQVAAVVPVPVPVPPKLMDVAAPEVDGRHVDDVLRQLGVEAVAGGAAQVDKRRACFERQVSGVPAHNVPEQLLDVRVVPAIEDLLQPG